MFFDRDGNILLVGREATLACRLSQQAEASPDHLAFIRFNDAFKVSF
jgi:hypothetical protein